jgi:hypothetical protein
VGEQLGRGALAAAIEQLEGGSFGGGQVAQARARLTTGVGRKVVQGAIKGTRTAGARVAWRREEEGWPWSEERREETKKREKMLTCGSYCQVASTSAKPPTKTTGWPKINDFKS